MLVGTGGGLKLGKREGYTEGPLCARSWGSAALPDSKMKATAPGQMLWCMVQCEHCQWPPRCPSGYRWCRQAASEDPEGVPQGPAGWKSDTNQQKVRTELSEDTERTETATSGRLRKEGRESLVFAWGLRIY